MAYIYSYILFYFKQKLLFCVFAVLLRRRRIRIRPTRRRRRNEAGVQLLFYCSELLHTKAVVLCACSSSEEDKDKNTNKKQKEKQSRCATTVLLFPILAYISIPPHSISYKKLLLCVFAVLLRRRRIRTISN